MGATRHENNLEFTDNIANFYDRTGLLCYYGDLKQLGFNLANDLGIFGESYVETLMEFCAQNPGYHIISGTHSGWLENRYVPGQRSYFLAAGDKNPHLVLNVFLHKNEHLLTEEWLDEALTMLPDVDRRDKAK